ncbi:MAG: UDP-N-acetylmuramoyl-tripeptide--D-alanyl-D-alanine ligase [Pseudomonadota bacterium]
MDKVGRIPLWTGREIADALNIAVDEKISVDGISIDTRSLEPGDLFVALPGEQVDGHKFVEAAFAAGAVAAMVSEDYSCPPGVDAGALIRVADPFLALVELGKAARNRSAATIIGVTGSAGKTGVKDTLGYAFSQLCPTQWSVKSYNNHLGVPLTLARLHKDTEVAIFEMGMNHAGEISALTAQVRPHIALITTVAGAHKENFASEEGIADAKAEIFEALDGPKIAILPADNRHFERLKAHAERLGASAIHTFAADPKPTDQQATVQGLRIKLHADCSCVSADVFGQKMIFKVGIPGHHWVQNALAILCVGSAAHADLGRIALALAEIETPEGRGNRIDLAFGSHGLSLINDSYNANPASMRASFATLSRMEPRGGGRRVVVLGDMKELGPTARQDHADLAPALIKAECELLIAIGDDVQALADEMQSKCTVIRGEQADNAVIGEVVNALRPGDIVLVKGSNASGVSQVVRDLVNRFGIDASHQMEGGR